MILSPFAFAVVLAVVFVPISDATDIVGDIDGDMDDGIMDVGDMVVFVGDGDMDGGLGCIVGIWVVKLEHNIFTI